MLRLSIAYSPGRCHECACRYRPGEVVIRVRRRTFHADCYRTRGALDLRPYEDEQPRQLAQLRAVIEAEEILTASR